jgi:hypothetical protein
MSPHRGPAQLTGHTDTASTVSGETLLRSVLRPYSKLRGGQCATTALTGRELYDASGKELGGDLSVVVEAWSS